MNLYSTNCLVQILEKGKKKTVENQKDRKSEKEIRIRVCDLKFKYVTISSTKDQLTVRGNDSFGLTLK